MVIKIGKIKRLSYFLYVGKIKKIVLPNFYLKTKTIIGIN